MLERDFALPAPELSKRETQKRLKLLDWFSEYIRPSVTGLLITGSMSYGQNHSVKTTSDLDMQLLVSPKSIESLLRTTCFDKKELMHAIDGFKKGLYGQFSLVFTKDDVPMECHFWNEDAFLKAVCFKVQTTKRLRSAIDTPSTDYAYAFDREENVKDYYGEIIDGFGIADFPSYRIVNNKLFLSRPITNILGIPIIKINNSNLTEAIDNCWKNTLRELILFAGSKHIDFNEFNIANTLPGKNKMSPEALHKVQDKTLQILKSL